MEYLEFAEDGCDACHMSGRRSRFQVTLEGCPYNRETHEPIDSEDEDKGQKRGGRAKRGSTISSGSSSSSASADDKLPQQLLLGKFCRRRADVFHQMSHWGKFSRLPPSVRYHTRLPLSIRYHTYHTFAEDCLYYRVRGYYRDLLRAKFKPVPSDSEASSDDTDPESDREEAARRRQARERKRTLTDARVKRLRGKSLVEEYKDVGQVTEWMDGLGYQNKVGLRPDLFARGVMV